MSNAREAIAEDSRPLSRHSHRGDADTISQMCTRGCGIAHPRSARRQKVKNHAAALCIVFATSYTVHMTLRVTPAMEAGWPITLGASRKSLD